MRNEHGSASVEFAALAIPLFIPLFLYMNSFASMSDGQDSLRTLAREAARGFVTSSNDEIAYGVAHQILTQGAQVLGYQKAIQSGEIQLHIECSIRPCISPNATITVTVTRSERERPDIKVSAIAYVSPWA
jgi:Flp pilus assembly protein TadG